MNSFDKQLVSIRGDLYRFAMQLTKDPDNAEDLVQDTLVRALTKRKLFEPGTNMRSWAFTIMHNLFTGEKRKEKVREKVKPTVHIDDVAPYIGTQENQFDHMVLEDLKRVWESLPRKYQKILLLINIDGYSYEKAARKLGCPIGTVMSRLRRARRTLHNLLDPLSPVPV